METLKSLARLRGVLLVTLSLLLPQASAQQPAQSFAYSPKVERLPNGLTIALIPFNSPGLVAYQTVVRVGSRNEVEPGHTGFAHFFEHMMFKGTKRYSADARGDALARAGWSENAFTTDDFTVYHLVGPSAKLPELIEFEADRFQNLEYSEAAFQTEALAVLGEYHKSAARPELKMEEALLSTAFTRHTYQHTTLGFYEDIQKMPTRYEYSKQFFRRWYTPDNTTLVIAGDFDEPKLLDMLRKAYGGWTGKAAAINIPAEPPQRSQRIVELPWTGATLPRLVYAWHTPASRLDTLDAAVQRVLADYLLGPTSTLHRELVLEKQLVEEVDSWSYEHRDPYLAIAVATLKDEKNRRPVELAFGRAIKDLVAGRIDAARVDAIKSNARYEVLMSMETPAAVASAHAWQIGVFGDPKALERQLENLSRVTPKHLQDFAKEYFTANNRTVLHLVLEKPKPTKNAPKAKEGKR